MVVLKAVPALLSPELLYALARMGHGDEIVLADVNFPTSSICRCGPEEIRADGLGIPQLLEAMLKLLPLDTYVEKPAVVMELVPSDRERGLQTPVWRSYQSILLGAGCASPLAKIERFEFYERAKKAFAIVATGVPRWDACVLCASRTLLRLGRTPPCCSRALVRGAGLFPVLFDCSCSQNSEEHSLTRSLLSLNVTPGQPGGRDVGTGPPPLQVPLSPNLLGSPAQKRSKLRPLDFYRGFITEAWLVKSLAIGAECYPETPSELHAPRHKHYVWSNSSDPIPAAVTSDLLSQARPELGTSASASNCPENEDRKSGPKSTLIHRCT
nr:fucose mutarotase isoform X1 [Camelus bactrianus]